MQNLAHKCAYIIDHLIFVSSYHNGCLNNSILYIFFLFVDRIDQLRLAGEQECFIYIYIYIYIYITTDQWSVY